MEMSDDVKFIEHMNRLGQAFSDHLEISLPHVAAHKVNVCAGIWTNVAKATHQRLDLASWADGKKASFTFVNLIDKGHVIVALADVNLIHSDGGDPAQNPVIQAPFDR
jgi:hypothetical protein